jgi:isopentenyl-diphosphate Delta-isomerase
MQELLILVDEKDNQLGTMEKLEVHKKGLLHRAFSVFIFNSEGKFLLQQRADEKYHSPGLWSNTCCSHPLSGETVANAVKRRLGQEMGMQTETTFQFSFIYKKEFDNGLTEYEFDHVYFGKSDELPHPDPAEVKNWKYISLPDLKDDILQNPDNYTEWLKICFEKVLEHLQQNK